MKETMQKTALKLTKSQLQTVLNDHIIQENGINDLFTMLINGLMFIERQTFLSESEVSNKGNGSSLVQSWKNRTLANFYPVVYIDAIHIKVRRDTVATEAFYILLGLKEDYTREVLGIINIPQESASGWQEVLESIKSRGVESVGLFVFDGLTGLDNTVGKVYSSSSQQQCTLHFQRNLYKHIRKTDRVAFCEDIKVVFNPDDVFYTPEQAEKQLKEKL